jgi:hypothetical protein
MVAQNQGNTDFYLLSQHTAAIPVITLAKKRIKINHDPTTFS